MNQQINNAVHCTTSKGLYILLLLNIHTHCPCQMLLRNAPVRMNVCRLYRSYVYINLLPYKRAHHKNQLPVQYRLFHTSGVSLLQHSDGPRDKSRLHTQWEHVLNRFNDIKAVAKKYRSQASFHLNKMTKSLREANKRIKEQELESADNKLNFKKDMVTNMDINDLPSQRELHRMKWSRRMEFYFDSLQETLFTATRALNDVTGYSSIQKLRNSIQVMEQQLDTLKKNVKEYKSKYNDAIQIRIQSQKEVNDLLQRKSSWSAHDLDRFTQLYKDDTINSQNVEALKEKLYDVELQEDQLNDELYRAILTRYHEEQIWSDKIRRTSTWGTFILMGMNICLFLILQLLLEPWKRRRLTRSFEDKVKSAIESYSNEQQSNFQSLSTDIKNTNKHNTNSNIIEEIKNNSHSIEDKRVPFARFSGDPSTWIQTLKINASSILSLISDLINKLRLLPTMSLNSPMDFTSLELSIYSAFLIILERIFTRVLF